MGISPARILLSCAIAPIALLVAYPAYADDTASINNQIQSLQQQIHQQQQKMLDQQKLLQKLLGRVTESEAQAKSAQEAAAAAQLKAQTTATEVQQTAAAATAAEKPAASKSGLGLGKNNRPTWTSSDGLNSISLTSIFDFDVGGYNYHPERGNATQHLNSGVNARRARIGVNGTLDGVWKYDLQYDFGNYDDNLTDTNAPKSGIKSAFISYEGFKPFVMDLGYLSVPYTLDQATAPVDYMFMEHPISQALAIAVAGGDSRSAFGARYFTDQYWVGGYLTGPRSGTSHTTAEQVGGTLRATYQVVQTDDASLHLGVDGEQLFKRPGTQTISFTTEPELSIDPTALAGVTLGSTTHPLKNMTVVSGEAAGGWRNLFFQGEYFYYDAQVIGLKTAAFDGGYLQGSWTMTGEHRQYIPDSGAYGRIYPTAPFSMANHTWGAWELAVRLSYADLNSNFVKNEVNTASAIDGGKDFITTVGLSWYVNNNLMFRINYLHGGFDELYTNITSAPSKQKPAGANFDALALRAQLTF
jgi:phosphate-selective porin OprO/OprP